MRGTCTRRGLFGRVAGILPGAFAARFPRAHGRATASVRLGVATYSLRAFSRPDAIGMIRDLGVRHVNVKSFHLPYESSPAELAAGRREFERAGLEIVGGGTVSLKQEDDAHIRRHFEYARHCGMPLLVVAPTPATLPRIESFAVRYDMRVAIHNHGPEDPYFPGPGDILPHIRNMDRRVGLCVDVGHTARTGADVVDAIALTGERLLDMHMKDLRDLRDMHSGCVVGRGIMPVAAIFRQLRAMQYQGLVNLEYEVEKDDPLPGMKESLAYMRGVVAGLQEP